MKLNIFMYHAKDESLALLNHKNSQWLRFWPSCGKLELRLLLSFVQSKVLNPGLPCGCLICKTRDCQVSFLCAFSSQILDYLLRVEQLKQEKPRKFCSQICEFLQLDCLLKSCLSLLWLRQNRKFRFSTEKPFHLKCSWQINTRTFL